MEKSKPKFNTIDEYIALFPEQVQKKLTELRNIIQVKAPEALEKISYQMPTFYLYGNLVHFAAYAKHIGFYPTSSGVEAFESELGGFKHARGSIQFPIEEPLPVELIKRIVMYRVEENLKRQKENQRQT